MHKAILWRPGKNNAVQCTLCCHYCLIPAGGKGACGVRLNDRGVLYTLVADKAAALNLDPVEKKPLFHFLPGTQTLSLGTEGCNMGCVFCQNHHLSQPVRAGKKPAGTPVSPDSLVKFALHSGAQSISYTYTEPTVFSELVISTSAAAAEHGLKNILVSNGYQSPEALSRLDATIHAANFDLKSFSDNFYRAHCGARLKPVLRTLRAAKKYGWWVEITTLVIDGMNDSMEELQAIATFIAAELGQDVPWHVSRFHPAYRMTGTAPTVPAAIERALESGYKAGLRFVYAGNMPGHAAENTYCPVCGQLLISRVGFTAHFNTAGRCARCNTTLPGIWTREQF
jgi:pyruvate formate lyase activating enzyme